MKPNVDLTADRMFPDTRSTRFPDWIKDENSDYFIINKMFNDAIGRLPWESMGWVGISSDVEFTSCGKDCIAGTPEDYRKNEEINRACSDKYCDRCGQLIKTPWWSSSLCEACNIALYKDVHYKKVPWEEESTNRAIIDGRIEWIE